MSNNARDIIKLGPMTGVQIGAIGIAMALNALDGFDLLAINFASPGIAAEFNVSKSELGVAKSMGLVGMSVGSLALAPMADRYGRRPLILTCTSVMAVSMFASAFVQSMTMLLFWRLVTGVGIGAMLASLPALSAEFSNERRRDLCVSITAVGLPLGSVIGGFAAAELLEAYSWRSVFIFGGVVSAAFIPVVAYLLPESIEFLSNSRHPQALARVNAILVKMGHPEAETLAPANQSVRVLKITDLFAGPLGRFTALMTAAYSFQLITFYYFMSWTPDIIADLGHHPSEGARILTWANIGGVAGAISIGWAAMRFGVKAPTIAAMAATAAIVVYFGSAANNLLLLTVTAAVVGLVANAGIVGLYVMMAKGYPTNVRVFGTGFSIGVGRMGGILAPMFAGLLFQWDVGRGGASAVMALGALLAALIVTQVAARVGERSSR